MLVDSVGQIGAIRHSKLGGVTPNPALGELRLNKRMAKMIETDVLRPYQQDILNRVRGSFRKGNKRIMLQSPTGSGKSVIAAAIIEGAVAKGNPVLFLTERITLALQMADHIESFGLPHNLFQGENSVYRDDAMIHIGTIQTISRRKHPDFSLIIADEAHVLHKAHLKMFEQYSAIPVLGLSATPWAKGLGKHFDDLVVGSTISELIDSGYLVDTVVYAPSAPDVSRIRIVAGDYDVKALSTAASDKVLVGDIVTHWINLGKNQKTICFAVDIAHSKLIVDRFNDAGIIAAHLDAYSDSQLRHETIQRFKNGEIDVLSSVDLLGRGFDVPDVGCVIMARPTKSLMVYVQQVGRGLRIAENKKELIVLDHAGNTARHGFITDEFPTELDDGIKTATTKEAKEKEEKLPSACPMCHFMKESHICPQCGFEGVKRSKIVEEAGDLVQMKKRKKYENLTKQEAYSQLIHIQIEHGYKSAWAANKYRDMFGVWPRSLREVPAIPSMDIRNFVKASNIRWAHRRNP